MVGMPCALFAPELDVSRMLASQRRVGRLSGLLPVLRDDWHVAAWRQRKAERGAANGIADDPSNGLPSRV